MTLYFVLGIVLIALVVAYKTIEKNLMQPPKTYPKVEAVVPNKKILVCAGDSITHGNVSHDWVEDLRSQLLDYQIFNAGVNSDLSYTLRNRLDDIIAVKPHHINILIGTNDIMAQARPLKKSDRYIKLKKIAWGEQPTIQTYENNLRQIIQQLKKETRATISIMSIPIIGEDLEHPMMKTVENYNKVVKNIANTEGVTYLPLFENQMQFLKEKNAKSHIPFEKTESAIISAAQQHILLRRSFDKITEKRGHLLTFDNLHFNSGGGQMMKDLLSGHLKIVS
jgi:lysophospholipase L1-like esterase